MSFIVYEKVSTYRIDNLNGGPDKTSFATERAAKSARTRFLKAQLVYTENDILITDSTVFYDKIEKDRQITNLMTKQPVMIKANTPWCCNPSSETYWSM